VEAPVAVEFTRSEAAAFARYVGRFGDRLQREVVGPLAAQLRGVQPSEVSELLEQLALVTRALEIRAKRVWIHAAHQSLLKRVLIDQRREVAEAIDVPLQKTVDMKVTQQIRRELLSLEHLMSGEWFEATTPLRVPALTDYLSIRHAEAALPEVLQLSPREYDEKFQILEAPSLFLPDLAYYRRRCRFRDASIAVAFLDIDDFKSFNTRHTETKIDRVLLAPFMEALEAHVFAHGHAYRFGGDEYVLLLPNMMPEWALAFVRSLQARLAQVRYAGIDRGPTLSAGLVVVDVECWFTEREILARANEAKQFAKSREKGRVAGYTSPRANPEDLALLD
jgi:diguanylate cyclase (GGDEF)-like protein